MDQFKNTSESIHSDDENSYWMSIGDLMSGLMFIFILALSVFMINITELTEELVYKEETREEILQEIKDEMEARGFTKIKIINEQGILRLEEGILFNSGEARLLPRGEELLRSLGPITYKVLSKPEYKGEIETVFIEGHTDNDPVSQTNRFQSNWDLSTQRAINTWLYMRDSAASLKDLRNTEEEPIFSVSGYADSRPIASNETDRGKRLNRRIDFRFNMIPPKSEDSEGPIGDIEQAIN